jgi:hypothetical protein
MPLFRGLSERVIRKSYPLAVARSLRNYGNFVDTSSGRHIFIYTPGQVGSTAIKASLDAVPGDPYKGRVHHLHFLNPVTIKADIPYFRWYHKNYGHVLPHYLRSLYIRKKLDKGMDLNRVLIVSAVRDPIRSNIAGFFQSLYRLPEFDMARLKESDSGELMDEFARRYIKSSDISYHLTWLDYQVRDVFGIDVYAEEFQKSRDYHIYRAKHPHLLVLKTEMLNEVAEPAMREFLETDDFTMVRSNTAADKDYAEHYREFLKHIHLPKKWFETVRQSRFLQHFYTEEEQEKILVPWRGRLA